MPNGNSNAAQSDAPPPAGGTVSADGTSSIAALSLPPKENIFRRAKKFVTEYTQDPSTDNFYYWTCIVSFWNF